MDKVLYIDKNNSDDISEIVSRMIKNEKVIIIPTDTIYGFSSLDICEGRIRDIKKRDDKPFLYLISNIEQLSFFNIDFGKYIDILEKNWPNMITFLMKNNKNEKIGIRFPDNDFLIKIIDKIGKPIVSTSVNYSGEPILNNENEIIKEFYEKVDLIVIDKNYKLSMSSTIVDISEPVFKIIREGIVKFKC